MESEKGRVKKAGCRLKYDGRWAWTTVDKVRRGRIMKGSKNNNQCVDKMDVCVCEECTMHPQQNQKYQHSKF